MRVTTSSMVRNYNSALSTSLNSLDRSRETVYSGKKFTKSHQDPTGALRASQLWHQYDDTIQYLSNIESAKGRLDTGDEVIQKIGSLISNAVNDEGLKGLSNATEATRKTYADTFRQLQQSLIQLGNTKQGESYLFAGADGANAPFSMAADGTVTYRGIDVNDFNLDDPSLTPAEKKRLESILNEKVYVDLGMGMQVNTSNGQAESFQDINGASAFDVAMNGLSIFGSGETQDGISKNAIALLGQMADELEKPDGAFDRDKFVKMRDQLDAQHKKVTDYNASLGVRQSYLTTKKERLEDQKLNIYTQIDAVQNAKPTEAITDYSYSSYVYNMVLKVGTSLLTSSFIDFMK